MAELDRQDESPGEDTETISHTQALYYITGKALSA